MGFDQWVKVQIFVGVFGFVVVVEIDVVGYSLILQVVFVVLIVDWVVQWVVDQQEFYDVFVGFFDYGVVGFDFGGCVFWIWMQIFDLYCI